MHQLGHYCVVAYSPCLRIYVTHHDMKHALMVFKDVTENHPFSWTPECQTALDTLIEAVTNNPTLAQPDLTLPFFLQVDASAYTTGAILTQKDTRGKHQAIGFLSKTFNEAKQKLRYTQQGTSSSVQGTISLATSSA